jgi:hypothetical protein
MKMRLLVCAAAVLVAAVIPAWAQEAPKGVEATVTGINYCPEKALKTNESAAEGTAGSRHALKVVSAVDADGKALADLEGATLHYLFSDNAKALSDDEAMRGQEVVVKGKVFVKERMIDVASAEVAASGEEGGDEGGEEFDYSSFGSASNKPQN